MSSGVVSNVSPWIVPRASGFQPVERSPPRNGRKTSPWSRGSRSASDPDASASVRSSHVVEVAAVRERAALDDATLVGEVEEEARLRLRPLALVEHAERARGADHERGALARRAAGAGVRAGGVGPDRDVRDLRQPLAVDSERGEQLLVPVVRREVEQAARRRHREARLGRAAQVVGERDEPLRAAEDLGLVLGEPGELRRPERRVEERAGSCVHRVGVELPREPLRRARRCVCRASRGSA